MTQPILVTPPDRQRVATVTPAIVAYDHRFGNVPWYVLARFLAVVLDVFGVGFVLAAFAFHAVERGAVLLAGHDATGFGTIAILSLGGAALFAFLCEALFGTTLGKLVFALHVRRANGRHAGVGRIFARAIVRPIDLLVIGPLLALVTPRHQRLGDLFAGTVVGGSRLGGFASLIGVVLFAGLAYAQLTFGGGLAAVLGVAAETANDAPAYVERAASAVGVTVPQLRVPQPQTTPQAQTTPQTEPSSPAASGTSGV